MKVVALLVLPVLVACASRTVEENAEPIPYLDYPTAKMLDAPPCPPAMREGIEGLSANDDWRLVEGPGIHHCVPAGWQRLERDNGGAYWYGDNAGVYAWSASINQYFGATDPGGNRIGYMTKTIGGVTAEIWYGHVSDRGRTRRMIGDRMADANPGGYDYESYAIWRKQDLAITGLAASMTGVQTIRRIYQTVRFNK
jgi:hypothetical protein